MSHAWHFSRRDKLLSAEFLGLGNGGREVVDLGIHEAIVVRRMAELVDVAADAGRAGHRSNIADHGRRAVRGKFPPE